MVCLSEIDTQPLSTLVCTRFICKACGIIDSDWNRSRFGHRCQECNTEGEGGALFFPISIHILVDLIQQSFHSQASTGSLESPQGSDVDPVLYFCTLREALLNAFLVNHMRAQRVPQPLVAKLLDDNKAASQKFGGLFSSVVGVKWPEAVACVSRKYGADFKTITELMRAAAEHRNEFLHSGRAWSFSHGFATQCVNSTGQLIDLFVALHNEYTRPLLPVGADLSDKDLPTNARN